MQWLEKKELGQPLRGQHAIQALGSAGSMEQR